MGIRFSCHGCGKPLNIKSELAGRRGVCPDCRIRFRIPRSDSEYSIPLEDAKTARQEMLVGAGAKSDAKSGVVAEITARGATADGIPPHSSGRSAVESDSEPTAAPNQVDQTSASALDLLSGDSSTTWYVRPPSGGQYGPATAEVLKTWIAEGRVAKTALLWRDGWPQWREASAALPEFADSLPGGPSDETETPIFDSPAVNKLTTPISLEKTSPVQSNLSGDAKIGAVRRKRSSRRITLVAILGTLVVGLIVTLILVATSSGS